MQCSQCQSTNPAGAKFCVECGSPLALLCPSCGSEPPPTARFCPQCATPLTAESPSTGAAAGQPSAPAAPIDAGERRHLTVLFCDVVNSTGIAASLDPEQWHAIATQYQRTAAEAVSRVGGYIARFIGDGLVAYFGYPDAREDAAERAVRGGLAIIET